MHNFIDEKFWLAIAFLAFVFLLYKYVWPILSKTIADHSNQIAKDLLDAKEMKEKALNLLKESEEQYQKSLEFSKKLIIDAENEAKKLFEDAKMAIEKDVAKKTEALNNRIKNEEEKTIRDIKEKIIKMAFVNVENELKNSENNIVKRAIDDIISLKN